MKQKAGQGFSPAAKTYSMDKKLYDQIVKERPYLWWWVNDKEKLCYFEDMDYSEAVECVDYAPEDNQIREFLEAIAVRI